MKPKKTTLVFDDGKKIHCIRYDKYYIPFLGKRSRNDTFKMLTFDNLLPANEYKRFLTLENVISKKDNYV